MQKSRYAFIYTEKGFYFDTTDDAFNDTNPENILQEKNPIKYHMKYSLLFKQSVIYEYEEIKNRTEVVKTLNIDRRSHANNIIAHLILNDGKGTGYENDSLNS
ncbi:hypothetical protein BpHYR1_023081 [Brachionus plicatilis]|uniref:Uncharacterized protein n=1 Tax=Brachionus plicatilis TaxID=10195 RepID=A0A3M7QVT0_BRAPC|nr:hypothetical protein BpHYR1_023081 [Brachionus plicatilis]